MYQNKVTISLTSIHNCKMAHFVRSSESCKFAPAIKPLLRLNVVAIFLVLRFLYKGWQDL